MWDYYTNIWWKTWGFRSRKITCHHTPLTFSDCGYGRETGSIHTIISCRKSIWIPYINQQIYETYSTEDFVERSEDIPSWISVGILNLLGTFSRRIPPQETSQCPLCDQTPTGWSVEVVKEESGGNQYSTQDDEGGAGGAVGFVRRLEARKLNLTLRGIRE